MKKKNDAEWIHTQMLLLRTGAITFTEWVRIMKEWALLHSLEEEGDGKQEEDKAG